MRALIQRVTSANVVVQETELGAIQEGILAFVAVEKNDTKADAIRLFERIIGYRVFADENDKMNLSLLDVSAGLLIVPQFTLAANTHKGMRPSFSSAASPEVSEVLFDFFCSYSKKHYPHIETGKFAANMKVSLCNDGPVTFLLEVRDQ